MYCSNPERQKEAREVPLAREEGSVPDGGGVWPWTSHSGALDEGSWESPGWEGIRCELSGERDSEWRSGTGWRGEVRSGPGCPRMGGPGDICFHSRAGAELGGAVLQADGATPGPFPAVLPALAEDAAENQAPPIEA